MQTQSPKKNNFAERIEAVIKARSITMYRLAKDAGLQPNSITALLRNGGDIKGSTLAAIAAAYPEINARWLLTGEGDMLAGSRVGGAVKGGESPVGSVLTPQKEVQHYQLAVNDLAVRVVDGYSVLPAYFWNHGNA